MAKNYWAITWIIGLALPPGLAVGQVLTLKLTSKKHLLARSRLLEEGTDFEAIKKDVFM